METWPVDMNMRMDVSLKVGVSLKVDESWYQLKNMFNIEINPDEETRSFEILFHH